eukprot:gene10711-11889_t
MLRLARFSSSQWGHHRIFSSHQLKNFTGPSSLVLSRQFWGFSDKNDEDQAAHPSAGNGQGQEAGSQDEKGIVSPTGDNSPTISPLLILPSVKRPVFPGNLAAVVVKDEATIDALLSNKVSGNYAGLFFRKDDQVSDFIRHRDEIYEVGTFGQIQHVIRGSEAAGGAGSGTQIIFLGHRRISLDEVTAYGPPTVASVTHWKKPLLKHAKNPTIKAYTNEVLTAARELIKASPLLQEQMQLQQWASRMDFTDPYRLVDFVTALTTADGHELQRILQSRDIEERLILTLEMLAREKELAKIQREINRQVEEKVSKQQREYFLREQLKSIKKELGMEKDDKEELSAKYHSHLQEIKAREKVSKEAITVIESELKKLEALEKNSPEFNVIRSYLDWLVALPWGKYKEDQLDLKLGQRVLNEDHYGLDDIKTRILEFMAVGKLTGSITGKILCFIGPPGVGKTSIAKSVARALDRPFYRFSVGGLTDTAEIKGHRRTYIGAMPGKPIQCLKLTQCMNPVLLIDEIDKLGRHHGSGGDPASALLELLDPNQNAAFVDHYLDTPVDFSQVLFVCTANDEATIPGPLKDRMEVIRLSGYDMSEKIEIAKRYLVPKALKENGLMASGKEGDGQAREVEPLYAIPDETLDAIIKGYCREAGVRHLEKTLDKIVRKLAYKKVIAAESSEQSSATASTPQIVTPNDLEAFIGKPIFLDETIYSATSTEAGASSGPDSPFPPGIVMGLAWNPLGGSPIFIETVALPVEGHGSGGGGGGVGGIRMVTGQLGDVMKESVSIAYTFVRKFLRESVDPMNTFFHSHTLHLHVPEGAVSKDGPSAGIAMASSLLSIATHRSLRPRLAMTGELSLTGKVLPVGGIKEKVLAAKRSGAKTIILPAGNKRDYDELPQYVKDDVDIHFVREYAEVYAIAFPNHSPQKPVQ